MQRKGVHIVVALLQDFAIPLQVGRHLRTARSAGYELQGRIDIAHLTGCILSFQPTLGSSHVSDLPRTIHFVSQTPAPDFVGFGNTVAATQLVPARAFFHIAILDESGSLLRSSGSEIQAHQRLGAHCFAPRHELVRAKLICVNRVPRLIEHARTILLWSYAIQPVVAGNEVAARIPDDWYSHLTNFLYYIFAQAIGIRESGPRIVNPFIDCPPKM